MAKNRQTGSQFGWMFPGSAPKTVREWRQRRLEAAVRSGAVRRLDPSSVSVERRQPVDRPDPIFEKIVRRIRGK